MADRSDFDPEAFDFAMPRTSTDPKQAGEFVRGAKYAPFDLLGAPVDIANLLMGGAGGTKPFLGSEYLIDKYADLGEAVGVNYDRPTGSTAETAGRLIGGAALDPGLLAAGIGMKFAQTTKTRGSGIEVKGSGAAELETPSLNVEAPSSDLGPMVREAGSDGFVPLEKKVGEARTSDLQPYGVNPPVSETLGIFGSDYSPLENVLLENKVGAGKKGLTGEQYLARLQNQPSVTKTELEVSGLASFLTENKTRKIPLEQVAAQLEANSPRIRMVEAEGVLVKML